MQHPSLITRLATLTLFVSGMALFVAYEAGSFSRSRRKTGISNHNAVLSASPGEKAAPEKDPSQNAADSPNEIQTFSGMPVQTSWEVMSSSKTMVLNHAGSAWMFPSTPTQPFLPSVQSMTANTSYLRK